MRSFCSMAMICVAAQSCSRDSFCSWLNCIGCWWSLALFLAQDGSPTRRTASTAVFGPQPPLDLSELSNTWAENEWVRGRLCDGKHLVHELTTSQCNIRTAVLNRGVLTPLLEIDAFQNGATNKKSGRRQGWAAPRKERARQTWPCAVYVCLFACARPTLQHIMLILGSSTWGVRLRSKMTCPHQDGTIAFF